MGIVLHCKELFNVLVNAPSLNPIARGWQDVVNHAVKDSGVEVLTLFIHR